MALHLHQLLVESIFDLVGRDEDGMTYSLGWILTQTPEFLKIISTRLGLGSDVRRHAVYLQHNRALYGRTDIELVSPRGAVILEAKKGFTLPSPAQLQQYVRAYRQKKYAKTPLRAIVVLTSWPEATAAQFQSLPDRILDIPVRYLSWRTLCALASSSLSRTRGAKRRQLSEFTDYVRRLVTMRDMRSNLVYVVPLNSETFDGGNTTFIDVVEKHRKYFHPVGNRYPNEPPNYIAFRYHGELQSIHFIKRVRVITTYKKHFPSVQGTKIAPHFLYDLGPAIRPSKTVKSGAIRNMRCTCMLDTLLTKSSISTAYRETQRRLREML